MLVGDVDAFGAALEAAGLGQLVIERDEAAGPATATEDEEAAPGPVDKTDEEGPTAGAEEPELPGSADERPKQVPSGRSQLRSRD